MIHCYRLGGYNIVLDINSGAVHALDELSYNICLKLTSPMSKSVPENLKTLLPEYTESEITEAYGELFALYEEGLLFSDDEYIDYKKVAVKGSDRKSVV